MTESTSIAGAETTEAAATTEATTLPEASTLLTDGTGGEQPNPGASEEAGTQTTEAEGKPKEGEEAPKPDAPESYADFTLPEGVELDAKVVEDAKALAKELGLSQENAQRVADLLAKQTEVSGPKAAKAFEDQQQAQVKTIHDEWVAQVKADKEIGGEKLAENLAKAKTAMEATTTPQLQALLQRTGLGNNVEVIRHFLRIAPAFSEDKFIPGGTAPAGANRSAADVLYEKTPST